MQRCYTKIRNVSLSRHAELWCISSHGIIQTSRFSTTTSWRDQYDFDAARKWYAGLSKTPLPRIGEVTYSRSSGPGGQNVNKYVWKTEYAEESNTSLGSIRKPNWGYRLINYYHIYLRLCMLVFGHLVIIQKRPLRFWYNLMKVESKQTIRTLVIEDWMSW